jgi:hypothetical protein
MKRLFIILLIVLIGLTACNSGDTADQTDVSSPNTGVEVQTNPTTDSSLQGQDQTVEMMEQSSGSFTARIFSAPETTINQQEYSLQGWTNHAAVVSVDDTIITTNAEDVFSILLQLEDGSNLVEVIISDLEGNEVRFEIIIFVDLE